MTNKHKQVPDTADDSLVGVPDHPAASLAGAVIGGAATGAVAGTAAGPVGTTIGAVVGAVIGGLGGDAVASSIEQAQDTNTSDPDETERREALADDERARLEPAYWYGEDACARYPERDFDEVEPMLAAEWEQVRGTSALTWVEARAAVRDAWYRREP